MATCKWARALLVVVLVKRYAFANYFSHHGVLVM